MLQNLSWTKATVRGKKAAFVVFNNCVWLLSYVSEWDNPRCPGYDECPRHSFFKRTVIENQVSGYYESWEQWRSNVNYAELEPEEIKFPGEEGFEREIRRRNRNANQESEQEVVPTPPSEGDGIDFYLPNYTRDNVYTGQNIYHSSHRAGFMNQPRIPFTGHRIGIELEIEAKNGDYQDEINAKSSNWFTRESDGSLGSYGIELITIPLLPDDAKSYNTWMPLCDYLKQRALSWGTNRCGLHVHIGREILGDDENERQMTLGKLLIFYQGDIENWQNAIQVFGRVRCYNQPNGDTDELNAVKCLGKTVLKEREVLNKVDASMKRKFRGNRYYAVNLQNSATIEFRKGRGSINADRIIAIVTFVESICKFCRATDAHELTLDNFKQYLFYNVQCGNPVFRYLGFTQQDS